MLHLTWNLNVEYVPGKILYGTKTHINFYLNAQLGKSAIKPKVGLNFLQKYDNEGGNKYEISMSTHLGSINQAFEEISQKRGRYW